MTSEARIAANRANAKKSTGPHTAAGKRRVAQNARRHGFNCPVGRDPALAQDVEAIARRICGLGEEPAAAERPDLALQLSLHLARRIAEAQVDLMRVQEARLRLLSQALDEPNYRSWRGLRARVEMLTQVGELIQLGATLPPEMVEAFHFRPEGAVKFALILADHAGQFAAFDRHEGRAMSRRRRAVRVFDEARMMLADPAAAATIDASSALALDLSVNRLLEHRPPRFRPFQRKVRHEPVLTRRARAAAAARRRQDRLSDRSSWRQAPGREGTVAFWRNKAKLAKAEADEANAKKAAEAAAERAKQAQEYAGLSLQEAARRIRELLKLDEPFEEEVDAEACRPP